MEEEKVQAAKAEVQRQLDVGFIREVTIQCCNGEEWEVADVYRLHGPQQMLSEGRLSPLKNR
jgi:hypothetical protein